MRSKKVELRIPHELHDLLTEIAALRGYNNVGSYIRAIAMYDAFHHRRVEWLRELSNLRKTTTVDLIMHELIVATTSIDDLKDFSVFLRDRRLKKEKAR